MWNYITEKVFPYECPFCGCGHAFPQETCDRCHKVVNRKTTPIYTMYPVIDIRDLEEAVNRQFDVDLELRELLFSDYYANDSYKRYWYDEMEEYEGHEWQDEEQIRYENMVKAYLQDILPDYQAVLIDVSW